MVKKQVKKAAFLDLVGKQKTGSKGSEISYGEKVRMDDYLMPNHFLKIEEKTFLWNWMLRSFKWWAKFKVCDFKWKQKYRHWLHT